MANGFCLGPCCLYSALVVGVFDVSSFWCFAHRLIPEQGHAASAPAKPMLWRKIVASTVIAGGLFVLVYFVHRFGFISFKPE